MSLRNRLLIVALVLLVTYTVTAVLIVRAQESLLIEQVDDQLARLPPVLEPPPLDQPPEALNDAPDDDVIIDSENSFSDIFIGIVTEDGAARPLFAGELQSATPNISEAVSAANGAETTLTIGAADADGRFRARVIPQPDGASWLVATRSLSDVDAAVDGLRQIMLAGGAIMLAVLAVAIFWVHRLGLRPIGQVTAAAEAIAAGDRSTRVDVGAVGTEAAKLAESFNVMLDERDVADARLRQFVADASHELRTPLTAIRGYLALYHQGAFTDESQLSDAMRRLSAESQRMSGLIEDLLALAQLDEDRPLTREPVAIGQLLHDAAQDARAVQPERIILVDAPALAPWVTGDRALLTQLVGILVANALAHTPLAAKINLSASEQGSEAVIVVADQGEGLDAEAAAHVFDRFWRKETGRSRSGVPGTGGGSGLGLSIARAITEAHHGTITLESVPGRGSTFTVRLPIDHASGGRSGPAAEV